MRTCVAFPRARRVLLHWLVAVVAGTWVMGGWVGPADANRPDAQARRAALLRESVRDPGAVARLTSALRDRDPVVARTAARLLPRWGEPARTTLVRAVRHRDALVRRAAVVGLGEMGGDVLPVVQRALDDRHPMVRQAAVIALAEVRPATPEIMEMLSEAGKTDDTAVREAVQNALRGMFDVTASVPLPPDGWKFRRDPDNVGRDQRWFAADLDDSDWDNIGIGAAWQEFGHDYVGAGWYRRTLQLPELPNAERAELAFGAVDEMAWVWVNGQYAGSHDIGPQGWDKPFRIDVSGLVKWGEENQITVRAENTGFAGGIWQPVILMAQEWAR